MGVGAMQPFMLVFSGMTHKEGKFENPPHTSRNCPPSPAHSVGVVTGFVLPERNLADLDFPGVGMITSQGIKGQRNKETRLCWNSHYLD